MSEENFCKAVRYKPRPHKVTLYAGLLRAATASNTDTQRGDSLQMGLIASDDDNGR